MVGTVKGQDLGSARGPLRQLEGAVYGFGSGITPVDLVYRIGERREDGFSVGNLGKLRVLSIDHQMHVLCSLLLDRGDNFGMAMTKVGHADS